MNAALENIHNRHSVRKFKKEQLSDEILETILNAANKAPSAHNKQSWKFIVIQGDKKNALADLVSNRSKEFPKPSSSILRMAARSIISAPTIIAIANTGELINHGTELFNIDKKNGKDFFRTMEIQSSAAAVENLLLAASSMDIGAVWLGIMYLIKDEVLEFLEEPAGEFMAVIPVGHAVKNTDGPKKKSVEYVLKKL